MAWDQGLAGTVGRVVALTALVALAAFHRGCAAELTYDPGEGSQLNRVHVRASVSEVLVKFQGPPGEEYRGADLDSYLLAGETLRKHLRFDWGFAQLWPPGQPILAALVVTFLGTGSYPLKMTGVAAVLWTGTLLLLTWAVRRRRPTWGVLAYAAGLWALAPSLRDFNFGFGAIMAEAASGAFFFAGAGALAIALRSGSRRWAVGSGGLIGVAALFRTYFELTVLHGLLGVMLLGWLTFGLSVRFGPTPWRRSLQRVTMLLTLVVVTAQATTVPWRFYRWWKWDQSSLVNVDLFPGWGFAEDERLPSFHHGANTICHVDQEACILVRSSAQPVSPGLATRLVVATAVTHPLAWVQHKRKFLTWLWFGRDPRAVRAQPALLLEGVLLLLIGVGALGSLGWRLHRGQADPSEVAWLLLVLTFLLLNVGLFAFLPYEWRYSQMLRLGCYFLPILNLAVRRQASEGPAERRDHPVVQRGVEQPGDIQNQETREGPS